METRCPFATWKPISHNITPGGRKQIRGFVPHVQVGTGSLHGFFDNPATAASADFWCSKTGVLEQYVDLVDAAWAQGSTTHNGNPYYVSCEFEGQPAEPMTPAQLDKGGQLIAWVYQQSPFPLVVNTDPDKPGITPHHVFGGGHTCPGPGPREGQFPDLILAALRHSDPLPQAEAEMLVVFTLPEGGQYLGVQGFKIPLNQPNDAKWAKSLVDAGKAFYRSVTNDEFNKL